MNLFDSAVSPFDATKKITGLMVGIVARNDDEEGLGRVKVRIPRLSDDEEFYWARVATFMSGNNMGAVFIPEVDDEVLVLFENGDITRPFVIGSLHNGSDAPPYDGEGGDNNKRVIKSRSGHIIRFDDTSGSEKIEIIDQSESNKIIIDSGENKITIESAGDLEIKATNGSILLDGQEITIRSSGAMSIESGDDLTVDATGNLDMTGTEINLN